MNSCNHESPSRTEPVHRIGNQSPPDRRGEGAGPTIVIADDEAHIRLVVGEKFRSEGFTVIEARDGEEALELVREHKPDVIVTDLQMPYMNGIELCTKVAADAAISGIPALLLTARGHIVDPAQLGATVIRKTMAKPFSAKALFESVKAILAVANGANTAGSLAAAPSFKSPLAGEAA